MVDREYSLDNYVLKSKYWESNKKSRNTKTLS